MRGAMRNQLSLLIQLHTGHVPLNSYLHRIQKRESARCNKCKEGRETVQHYLLECQAHKNKQHKMWRMTGDSERSLQTLFGKREGIIAVLQFVSDTGRLKANFGEVSPTNLIEMDNKLGITEAIQNNYDWPDEQSSND
ncbi:hypothetical protein J132_03464 [Termitomyces sp. J132]|nr:hypothetical protein J132_03464 [Termitomyces sp. J132]